MRRDRQTCSSPTLMSLELYLDRRGTRAQKDPVLTIPFGVGDFSAHSARQSVCVAKVPPQSLPCLGLPAWPGSLRTASSQQS